LTLLFFQKKIFLKALSRAALVKQACYSVKKDLAAKRSPLSLQPATEKSGALSHRFPQKIEFS